MPVFIRTSDKLRVMEVLGSPRILVWESVAGELSKRRKQLKTVFLVRNS